MKNSKANLIFIIGGLFWVLTSFTFSITPMVTKPDPLTHEIIKKIITRKENNLTKYSTGPKKVTVTFESIQIGKPRKPTEQDKIDNMGDGILYPVRVKYTSTHHYADRNMVNNLYNLYTFYVDSFEEWDAKSHGPIR